MIQHWTKFEGAQNGKRKEMARVTLGRSKAILLNEYAYRAIGEPAAVEMFFDGNRKLIGLKACDPQKKNAFALRRSKQGKHVQVGVGAFLTHFGIKPERTVLFEDIDIDSDGMLTLDLTKTTLVTRGSR